MSTKPETVRDLIGNWKTIASFAADVGCGYEAARKMRDRNSIAPEHWGGVVRASEKNGLSGITMEFLAALRTSERVRERA